MRKNLTFLIALVISISVAASSFAQVGQIPTYLQPPPSGGAPVTIFSHTFGSVNSGNQNTSTRVAFPITGASLGHLQFTVQAGTTAWKVVHMSVAIGATLPATTATLVEVPFGSGGHGFNITTPGASAVSDLIAFSATASNILTVTFDDDTTGNGDGGSIAFDTGQTGVTSYYGTPPLYQNSTGTGFTALPAGDLFGVSLVQTQ